MKEKTSNHDSSEVRLAEQRRDLALLNEAADSLNLESCDVLDYQSIDENAGA